MVRCVVGDSASKSSDEKGSALLVANLTDRELLYLQAVIEAGMEAFGYDHDEVQLGEDITSAIERRLE